MRTDLAWDGDRLVLAEDKVAKVARTYLSPSSFTALRSCPARHAADRLVERRDHAFGAAEMGTAAHLVLEELFTLEPQERTKATARHILSAVLGTNTDLFPENLATPTQRHAWAGAVWVRVRGLWQIESPMSVRVRRTEWPIGDSGRRPDDRPPEELRKVLLGDVSFVGVVDRTDWVDVFDDHENKVDEGCEVTDYKGLALDTPLPTPTGWTTMGDVQVGDELLGADGRPTKVTVKSGIHNRPCYQITFSDGSTVVCDNVHLWNAADLAGDRQPATLGADDLYALWQRRVGEGRKRSVVIPNTEALDLPDADLLVDPYLLGAWLGDGTAKSGTITSGRQDLDDMLVLLKERWPNVTAKDNGDRPWTISLGKPDPDRCNSGCEENWWTDGERRQCRTCIAARQRGGVPSVRPNEPFGRKLSHLGVLRNKHIPQQYLRASWAQRLDLLRGLMDTDGYWNPVRHRAEFVSADEALANQVAELLDTFGITATIAHHANAWKVSFRPTTINPFALPRKAVLVDEWRAGRQTRLDANSARRTIINMEPVASVPTQCVAVDAPDSLYLCGPRMVVTHNTGKGKRTVNPRWTDDHGDQIRLYAAAIEALDGKAPVRGRISYTKEGFSRYIDVSHTAVDKSVESLNKVWVELGRQAAANSFETRPSGLCPWCPLVSSCPAAAREGRGQPASQDGTVLQVPKVRRHRLRTAAGDAHPEAFDPADSPAAPAAVVDEAESDPINDFPDDPTAPDPAPALEPAPQLVEVAAGDASGTGAAPPTVPSTVRPSDSVGGTDMLTEAKPWEATAGGSLNPASYSSMAVFGTVSMAVKRLADASQPITGNTVRSLAGTYAHIVETVQTEFTGGTSPQDGMNTRLRGALHTAIETIPEPFGGDADAWNTWVDQVTKRVRAITKAAIALFDDGPGEEPWLNLATPVEVDQAA